MLWLPITAIILIFLFFAFAFALFMLAFYVKPKRARLELLMPSESLQKRMKDADMKYTLGLVREILSLPYEKVTVRSFDGLLLAARYYEFNKGAPLVILCHGYRGHAAADFRGIFQQVRSLGVNILLINERAHWESEGAVIRLGTREKRDVVTWARYAAKRFPDKPIALFGVSMGAATVLSSSALGLPESVRCLIADCGFTTPRAIMDHVLSAIRLRFLRPVVLFGARLYGRIDMNDNGALAAVKNTKLPVLFIHGEDDDFVPCDMSREMFAAAAGPKRLETFKGAAHLHSCLVDEARYRAILASFLEEYLE